MELFSKEELCEINAIDEDLYDELTRQGDRQAQYLCGMYLLKNCSYKEDRKKLRQAFEFIRKSASQDYALAQYILGLLYRDALGVPDSENSRESCQKNAKFWLEKAINNGMERGKAILEKMSKKNQNLPYQRHTKNSGNNGIKTLRSVNTSGSITSVHVSSFVSSSSSSSSVISNSSSYSSLSSSSQSIKSTSCPNKPVSILPLLQNRASTLIRSDRQSSQNKSNNTEQKLENSGDKIETKHKEKVTLTNSENSSTKMGSNKTKQTATIVSNLPPIGHNPQSHSATIFSKPIMSDDPQSHLIILKRSIESKKSKQSTFTSNLLSHQR